MPVRTITATTDKIIITEPYFRLILIRLSKKRTTGFAIKDKIKPTTKGAKNPSSFGTAKATTQTTAITYIKLAKIFKYLVDFFNLNTHLLTRLFYHFVLFYRKNENL